MNSISKSSEEKKSAIHLFQFHWALTSATASCWSRCGRWAYRTKSSCVLSRQCWKQKSREPWRKGQERNTVSLWIPPIMFVGGKTRAHIWAWTKLILIMAQIYICYSPPSTVEIHIKPVVEYCLLHLSSSFSIIRLRLCYLITSCIGNSSSSSVCILNLNESSLSFPPPSLTNLMNMRCSSSSATSNLMDSSPLAVAFW